MSKPTKLPGLFALRSTDPALNSWAQTINEHLEVRAGSRGAAGDATATQRDLEAVAQRINNLPAPKPVDVNALASDLATNKDLIAALAKTMPVPKTNNGWEEEIANLRAVQDALSRRINELSQAPNNGLAYGEGPDGMGWYIKANIGLAARPLDEDPSTLDFDTTVAAILSMLNDLVGYGTGPYGEIYFLKGGIGLSNFKEGYNTTIADLLSTLYTMDLDIKALKAKAGL